MSDLQALQTLAVAYTNVLQQAAAAGSNIKALRILPISGGVFAADYQQDIHFMTMQAICLAHARLGEQDRKALDNLKIRLCIFVDKELPLFRRAKAWETEAW